MSDITSSQPPGRFQNAFSPEAMALLIIAACLAVRIVLASVMGFSRDESYLVMASRELALGYFDHPPLSVWLTAAVRWLTGGNSPLAVRVPNLLFFAGATWIIYRLTARIYAPRAGLYAVAALSLAPLFSLYIGGTAVTDGPMLFGVALGASGLCTAIVATERVRWDAWLAAGLGFGLALMSKFIPVLLAPGILVFVLTQPAYRRWLRHPAPYVALAVTALFLMPSIVWNIANDWRALQFQGPRALSTGEFKPVLTLIRTGLLAVVVLPLTWLGLVVAVGRTLLFERARPQAWLLAWMALGPMLFFPLVGLFGGEARALHWVASGYLLAFPLLGGLAAGLTGWLRTLLRLTVIASVAAFAVVAFVWISHLTIGWLRLVAPTYATYDPILSENIDWWDVRAFLAERDLLDGERVFLIGDRWDDCSRLSVAAGDLVPVVCHTEHVISEAMADSADLIGRDGIYVTRRRPETDPAGFMAGVFATVEPLGPLSMSGAGHPLVHTTIYLGRDLQTPLDR